MSSLIRSFEWHLRLPDILWHIAALTHMWLLLVEPHVVAWMLLWPLLTHRHWVVELVRWPNTTWQSRWVLRLLSYALVSFLNRVSCRLLALHLGDDLFQERDKLLFFASVFFTVEQWWQLSLNLINVGVLLGSEFLDQGVNPCLIFIDIDCFTRYHWWHLSIAKLSLDWRWLCSMDQVD